MRESTICGTPIDGPRAERMPWVADPSAVPSTIAATAWPNVCWKYSTEMTPTKMVANSRFGDIHVQNRFSGRPCRSLNGMKPAPPGSTAVSRAP
jgi:hypothetical protein